MVIAEDDLRHADGLVAAFPLNSGGHRDLATPVVFLDRVEQTEVGLKPCMVGYRAARFQHLGRHFRDLPSRLISTSLVAELRGS